MAIDSLAELPHTVTKKSNSGCGNMVQKMALTTCTWTSMKRYDLESSKRPLSIHLLLQVNSVIIMIIWCIVLFGQCIHTVQPKPPDPIEQQTGLASSSSSPGSDYGNGTKHAPYSIIVSIIYQIMQ